MSSLAFDVSARLSDVVETTLKEGPQVITDRGVETAVLVPIEDWKRLNAVSHVSAKDPLLDPEGPHDIYIPPRRRLRLRPFVTEDECS